MTECLREEALVALATGDEDSAARRHVDGCAACAVRLAALEGDLARIRSVLLEAPVAVPKRHPGWRWSPFAAGAAVAAALVVLLLAPWRGPEPPVVAAEGDTQEFADVLSAAVFAATTSPTDLGEDAEVLAAALSGGSLCAAGYAGEECDDLLFMEY